MAALPPLRRLQVEDFKTQKSWIAPLLLVVNNFMEAIVGALNQGLTLAQNSTSTTLTVTLSSVPTPTAPTGVKWSKASPPVAVLVGNIAQLSVSGSNQPVNSSFTLSNAVQVQWAMSSDGSTLQITGIAGVTPSAATQYQLTLLCIAG